MQGLYTYRYNITHFSPLKLTACQKQYHWENGKKIPAAKKPTFCLYNFFHSNKFVLIGWIEPTYVYYSQNCLFHMCSWSRFARYISFCDVRVMWVSSVYFCFFILQLSETRWIASLQATAIFVWVVWIYIDRLFTFYYLLHTCLPDHTPCKNYHPHVF